jgi:hypothetical protein
VVVVVVGKTHALAFSDRSFCSKAAVRPGGGRSLRGSECLSVGGNFAIPYWPTKYHAEYFCFLKRILLGD